MLGLDKIGRFEHFAGMDKDVFEDTLSLAEKIAMVHFYPSNAEADKIGLTFDPKTSEVHVPDVLHPGYNAFIEAGFHRLSLPANDGGMGLPMTLSFSSQEYFNAGNTSLGMYGASLSGTARLLMTYGSEDIKKRYLPKMLEGVWGGTMCLTEAGAGPH